MPIPLRTVIFTTFVAGLTACNLPPPVTSRPLAAYETTAIEGLVYSLPRSVVRIKTMDAVTAIAPIEQVPDPQRRYVLEGKYLFSTNDDFEFNVENGLLTAVTANSEDERPQVVEKAKDVISSLLRSENEADFRQNGTPKLPNREFVFDPLKAATQTVMDYRITIKPIADPNLFKRIHRGERNHQSCQDASFCVPVTTPVQVRVRHDAGIDVETVLTVVDPTRSIGIQVNRSACARSENMIAFRNGIMTKYDVTRPSEVASCLSIPLNVLRAIISAPVDAITGRTAQNSAEQALLTSEIALLQERNRLLELAAEDE
jgi:hypothetical protein